MIAFADFAPEMTAPPGLLNAAQFESFDTALAGANQWIQRENIRVINVETVVLPNVWSPHEQGTTDPSLRTTGEFSTSWHQFVRVWYETDPVSLKPA